MIGARDYQFGKDATTKNIRFTKVDVAFKQKKRSK
jgi:hypothetical protein